MIVFSPRFGQHSFHPAVVYRRSKTRRAIPAARHRFSEQLFRCSVEIASAESHDSRNRILSVAAPHQGESWGVSRKLSGGAGAQILLWAGVVPCIICTGIPVANL